MQIDRRTFLRGATALAGLSLAPMRTIAAASETRLVAAPARAAIMGDGRPDTDVWAYNGQTPGPLLRFRQGDRARIVVENRLPQPTTVHWHGLRVPNAMDGVPNVTQKPIQPGESFVYAFDLPDAGTFWYHPHVHSAEQVERGLAGVLIVDEREPIKVDRDVLWVLDDWRLTPQAAVAGDFVNMMDASHAGRLGNTVTINGHVPEPFSVRPGERIRLRLVNVSNARIFHLVFEDHAPLVVALDGQPVEPHAPEKDHVLLGPGMRADLIIDMTARSDRRHAIIDSFYEDRTYRLTDIVYGGAAVREQPLGAPKLRDNPIPLPDLDKVERHKIELGGGMMDPKVMHAMREGGGGMAQMMGRMREGHIWTINGVSVVGHPHEPLLTLARGRSYLFDMTNDTAWHHPMHLHGMPFQIVARNGEMLVQRIMRDTVLMAPGERVEIAFMAAPPGDWMFHCHILEHQEAGMMGIVRVA